MNQTVLPQLQAVEAELASQESQLTEQLTSLQEKLSSIQSVMSMFSDDAESAPASATTEDLSVSDEGEVEAPAVEKTDAAAEPKPKKAKATASKKTAQKKATATQKKKAPKKTTAKQTDGRAASWQKYTRPGVKNQSMPAAVQLILETQPKKEFKIAEVMDALFDEKMPKAQYLKARNRISNVLSGGVRAGDWFKGDRGTYRMTEA